MSLFYEFVNSILNILAAISHIPGAKWLVRYFALSRSFEHVGWPENFVPRDGDAFDFIIVGAGSAGATIAARLSEISSWKILLVEAGDDPPFASIVPMTMPALFESKYDWGYMAKVDNKSAQAHPNSYLPMYRGKVLGGSSSLNFHIYSRGVPDDYNEWGDIAPGWDWDNVLPYFKKLEGMRDPNVMIANPDLHSDKGPVQVTRLASNEYFSNINKKLLDSFEELGLKRVLESNGPDPLGVTTPHFTIFDGRRSSTAEAYLRPAKDRENLFIAKSAVVTRVLIDTYKMQAYGVDIKMKDKVVRVYCSKEVILSAGAINTPKILMLSGIGPAEHIAKLGIDVILDLPVGDNLQDHAVVPLSFKGKRGFDSAVEQTMSSVSDLGNIPLPFQSGLFNLHGSESSRPMFQFFSIHLPAAAAPFLYFGCKELYYNDAFCLSLADSNIIHEVDFLGIVLLHPLSRGKVRLRSGHPSDDPLIDLGYFRKEIDLIRLSEAVKFMTSLASTDHFAKTRAEVVALNVTGCDKIYDYWKCYTRNSVTTIYHPVGTCSMGTVVNEKLNVHGIKNLRVADASIMPFIISGNTNVPTIMIGEKTSDIIKKYYGFEDD